MASDSAALKEKKVNIQTHFLLKRENLIVLGFSLDWCDRTGDGWQCSRQELEKRRVGTYIYLLVTKYIGQ